MIKHNIYGGKSGSMYQNTMFNIIDSTFYESKEENKNVKGPSDSSRPVTGRLQTHNLGYLILLSTDGKPRQTVMLWYLCFR